MKSTTVYATGACNQRCKHCSVGLDHHKPREQLSGDQMIAAIENLSVSGMDVLNLLGGEVTLYRNDLEKIYSHCSKVGTKVSLNTNLTSVDQISRIMHYSSFYIAVVSLDGVSSQTHNLLRGRGQFRKTARNLIWLSKERKKRHLKFEIHVTFVLNRFNMQEALPAIRRLKRLGVDKINFNHLLVSGRARLFEQKIKLSNKDIVESTAKIAAYWLMTQNIDMEIYISPAMAVYLERRWNITSKLMTASACGGPVDSYGYIDLNGNHLPCPAMAVEENPHSSLDNRRDRLDITKHSAEKIWSSSVFKGFERNRISRAYVERMFPCNVCHFKSVCYPCTAAAIKGNDNPEVTTCAALYRYMAEEPSRMIGGIFEFSDGSVN